MVKKRILSKDGATILIALLFFLLCAIAGSVILAAGSAASGRVSGIAETTQSYYSVTSAASVMQEELTGTMTITRDPSTGEYTYSISPASEPGNTVRNLLLESAREITESENPAAATAETTIDISVADTGGSDSNDALDVKGRLTMDGDYNITLVIYQESDDVDTYTLTLKVPGFRANIGDTGQFTQITWVKGEIN